MREKPTIFVQIASYRDDECKLTIRDLYEKAANPEQIFIGLNWQYAEEDEDVPFFDDQPHREQIRLLEYPHTESRGACWARSRVQSLYAGETYTLAIDAHMRFVQGWDQLLIDMLIDLQGRGYEKPVLTHYPPDYTQDGSFGTIIKKMVPVLREGDDLFIFARSGHEVEQGAGPVLSCAVAAGCHFTLGEVITEVPYDPGLYFFGEEISLAARYWTHGYDFFNPDQIFIYHLYKRIASGEGKIVKNRKQALHQTDHSPAVLNQRSKARVRHMLGTQTSSDPEVTGDLDQYGLGCMRSLQQYEDFSGLDFKQMTRCAYTRAGLFSRQQLPGETKKLHALPHGRTAQTPAFLNNLEQVGVKSLLIVAGDGSPTGTKRDGLDIQYAGFNDMTSTVELPVVDCILLDFDPHRAGYRLAQQIIRRAVLSGARHFGLVGDAGIYTTMPFCLARPDKTFTDAESSLQLWYRETIAGFATALDEDQRRMRQAMMTAVFEILRQINDPRIIRRIAGKIGIKSRSAVQRAIFTPDVNAWCDATEGRRELIETLINARFRERTTAVKKAFPNINEANSLLAMTLLADYFQILATGKPGSKY